VNQRIFEGAIGAIGITMIIFGAVTHLTAVAHRRPSAEKAASSAPGALSPAPSQPANIQPSGTFAIVDARVFDGRTMLERATVVVRAGVIESVGAGSPVPDGVPTVEASGKTLLPGLIDAHTHAFDDGLERALVFGVTTEVDMFTDSAFAAARRAEQRSGPVSTRADLVSAGTLATAPGGHGTEFHVRIPTITRPDEAEAFVAARVAEGSDFIKLVYDDGASFGLHLPTLSRETMATLVGAAHRRSKLVAVHVSTAKAAREVIEAGGDGLAHVFCDAPADPNLVALAKSRGTFVVPTLTVLAAAAGDAAGHDGLTADSALGPYIGPTESRTLGAARTARRHTDVIARAESNVASLHAAGVPILAGTDAPNPGTAHGISLHEELERLVRSSLSPTEALAAATSVPARVFGLSDRGRIAPGLRADLLLVDGDPSREIAATRRIVAIWKAGVTVERRVAASVAVAKPLETDGRVSEFESDASSHFGFGWQVSTDSSMGGTSTATMRVVADGAEASRGSLEVVGAMKPGSMFPWAGAMFFAGPQPMAGVNLSAFHSVAFWAKGDGGTYRVMVFANQLGRIPAERPFVAGPEWREVVIPFATFSATLDGSDLQAVLFSGSAGRDRFRLQIDNVRFR
jgi:imidazolonepropionase-like amidohydrolase